MRKIFNFTWFLFLIFLSLISCQSSSDNKEVKQNETAGASSYSRTYPFTSLEAQDLFTVTLTGNKPADMLLSFSIATAQGDEVFAIQIKGTDLLGSTDPNVDLRAEADQIAFIRNIAKEFLDDDQFLEPAVMPDQQADNWAPDPAFYDSLKKSGLNGFTYRLGKEDNYYIAFDPVSKEAKTYYNCC